MFPNVLATTATVVGIVATLVAALVAVLTYRQGRAKRARPTAELQPIISSTVEQLASAVRVKWRTEEGLRRIHDPFPLPVRWTNAHETLFDHWPNILGTLVSARSHGLDLSGSLDQIVNTFKRLPSGRLVVLGDAGSGKTILALRFVLDSLRYRNKDDPVPVVISMGSWNPNVDSFRDWIISRLIDQHPGLAKSVDADTLAPMLLDSDQILPVLDGFDEIAESLRPAALGALNLTNSPLILTSRPAEYLAAVDAADVLTRAAAVVLQGLTLDDLASYLPLTTRKTEIRPGYLETKWDPVIDRLRREQNNPAARIVQSALSSPLMVGLARVIYSDARDHDPSEMFDRSKFATDRAIEDHLLDAFIPAAYKHYPQARRSSRRHRNWEPAKAELWLGNIAVHLEHLGTRDLAWWQLRDSVPRITRMLVGAAIGAIGAGVLLGTVFNPWVAIGLGATFGAAVTAASQCRQPIRSLPGVHGRGMDVITILAGGVPGGLVGTLLGTSVGGAKGLVANTLAGATSATRFNPTVGLAVGVAAGFGFALAGRFTPAGGATISLRPQYTGPAWVKELGQGCMLGFVAGLLGSVALGYVGGWAVAVACILSVALVVGLETAVDVKTVATSAEVLQTDRHNALYMLALFGLTVWLAVTSASWQVLGHMHSIAFGFGSGLMDGLGFCLGFTAWGHWLVLTRGWLAIRRRIPFHIVTFLEDAHQRGVLRQAGAVYQFRHARLQDRLIERSRMREN